MKKILFFLIISLPLQLFAQESRIDTTAIMLLDRMSSMIGD